MMDNLFNDMEQNRKLEEMEEELERQREAVLKEALKQYQDAAMEGDPRAQYALAHAYFQAQDYVTSLSWWNQAAKKGRPVHGLGWLCSTPTAWVWIQTRPWPWIACGRPSTVTRRT